MAYIDFAANAPMSEDAIAAYVEAAHIAGNPSSIHQAGQQSKAVVEESRAKIAGLLGVTPAEVVFTSGGTESVNLALQGFFWQGVDHGRNVVIAPEGEHHSTIETLQWLEKRGAVIEWVPIDSRGRINLDEWKRALESRPEKVAFATCSWANNEVGTVQPVTDLVKLAHDFGVPIHVDAVAALGSIALDIGSCSADAVSLAAHKIGGPHGVGAAIIGRDVKLNPLIHGGGQERGLRSGTQNVPGIAAFAKALEIASAKLPLDDLITERDNFVNRVMTENPDVEYLGDPVERIPGNAHFVIHGCEGDSLLFLLDGYGIDASTGSACTAGVPQPSHVVLAMGYGQEDARSALRCTFGPDSTPEQFDTVATALHKAIPMARRAGMADRIPEDF